MPRRGGRVPGLPAPGRRIREATVRYYVDFVVLVAHHLGDTAAAKAQLRAVYGDSFWYYLLYRGRDRGVPIVTRATQPMP